jgi:hypothetical protein
VCAEVNTWQATKTAVKTANNEMNSISILSIKRIDTAADAPVDGRQGSRHVPATPTRADHALRDACCATRAS